MAALTHSIPRSQVIDAIDRLIDNLVNLHDETGEFLLRLDDGRVIDTKGWNDWEWTHGVGLFGLYRYWEQTGSDRALDVMLDWFRDRFAAGTPTKNINTMAPFLTLANLYEQTGDQTYLPYLDTWAEWLMAPNGLPKTEEGGFQHIVFNDENPGELWDDTLMMSVLPLARIGLLLGRPHYVEEAKRQFLVHVKYLADRKTGLWYHGWTFDGRHNFAEALWARGNCWVTIAIPEIIEMLDLPEGDAFRTFLIDALTTQVKTLAEHQHESGLWHTLITDPTSYLEASATAGFAYGILKAVRKRYISADYEAVGIKAIEGVLANIDEHGELKQVSFGTAMGDTLQFYKDIPLTSMPYGQSLAICALAEFLRTYI
ncbi:glycoside hydrolase family 88 protein [Sphingomonas cannabina]|uniref:beta-galactosidase BglB n=1 Tax=Sphingomonas cannabina TaxID=2899123 RepID=UPI001F2BC31D|nr:glycoside hydrolase family 88 protein [Sphingomonas cannabina]UIJ43981.1 glycoside hydrolase family 88 protein [Sphingomonas cannabina]